ncbi:MAG TPA: serine/threonine-protein kinase [Polyangiaceae bacterium]
MEAVARSRLPQLAKYDVIEEIGHGGMATVYRATDKRLGREVAVKVIHPHLRDSKEVVQRFNTEARAVAKLRHPNIVEVFDVSEADEPEQYLVVELLRGTTLRKLLQQNGAMPAEVAAALALELLAAIAHANAADVVHRDIKPENVLIEHKPPPHEGDRVVVKLTDFGIAKLLDAQGVTSTGQVLGSPAHMAPEQIEGGEVDVRADVFGMGVLLYECMVGHLPFEGNNPAQVLRRVLDGLYPEAQKERPIVGARWSQLLDRSLAHEPGARFPDAGAMREAILGELGRLGVVAPKRELETWLDDPEAYAKAHATRMIDRLCVLGAEEQKAGDALGAAADYNRALAHAPDDAKLLRIVAGMQRAQARAAMARRAGVALLLMVGLGAAAFVIGRIVQERVARTQPTASTVAQVTPPPSATPSTSASAPAPSASASSTVALRPLVPLPAQPAKPVERTITFDLSPPFNVRLVLDGAPPQAVSSGQSLTLDGKAHALVFDCAVCTTVEKDVPAGSDNQTISVKLGIKDATLEVRGDVNGTYQIKEHPGVSVHAGVNPVHMSGEYDSITVTQMETGVAVPVRLHAGHTVQATF